VEWFPDYEIQVTNLGVSPGDNIGIVLEHNPPAPGAPNQNSVLLTNNTTNQHVGVTIIPPAGTALVGNCVEWIVERPTENGKLSTLAPYGSIVMTGCDCNGPPGLYFPGTTNVPGVSPTGSISAVTMLNNKGQVTSQAVLGPPYNNGSYLVYDNIAFVYNWNPPLDTNEFDLGAGGTGTGNP
jgi:hypothetical protein